MCWLPAINGSLINSLSAEVVHAQKYACQKASVLSSRHHFPWSTYFLANVVQFL